MLVKDMGTGVRMKLLVVSDLHASEKAVEYISSWTAKVKPDALIVCGDLTHFGPPIYALRFLASIKVKSFAVPGNCDTPHVIDIIDKSKTVLLHRRKVEWNGETLTGLGGGLETTNERPFELSEDEVFKSLEANMPATIIVTHVPAKGKNDDAGGGEHLGSEGLLRIIERYKPRLALAGHVHQSRGIIMDDGLGTVFVNPGPAKDGYAAKVDIDGKDVEAELLG